jgi:hypothetical protein
MIERRLAASSAGCRGGQVDDHAVPERDSSSVMIPAVRAIGLALNSILPRAGLRAVRCDRGHARSYVAAIAQQIVARLTAGPTFRVYWLSVLGARLSGADRPAMPGPWAAGSGAAARLHRAAGTPVHPEWYSDEFRRLLRRAGLRRITLHDSRHTTLTLMACGCSDLDHQQVGGSL